MARSYATRRDTDTGSIVENFIDAYTTDDFSDGYGSLIDQLESLAKDVDDSATNLESRIEELEEEIRTLKGE